MSSALLGQQQMQALTWPSKDVRVLTSRASMPKSLRMALPARCRAGGDAPLPENPTKLTLKALPKSRLQTELETRGLPSSGNKPELVSRVHQALASKSHSGVAAQRGAVADKPAVANPELLRLREKVAALDAELSALQSVLEDTHAARKSEKRQLEALREEAANLQTGWKADRQALDDAIDAAQTVAESEAEVRELQGAVVQLSERVVKMQTLVKEKDECIAELQRRLKQAKPAFAMAGAAGAAANPSLNDLLAGMDFGGGAVLPEGVPSLSGIMADATLSAQAASLSWPLESAPLRSREFRSDILQQPEALGVMLAAGSLAAAGATDAVWSSVRRIAPPEQRRALDAAAVVAVGSVAAAAAFAMSQQS